MNLAASGMPFLVTALGLIMGSAVTAIAYRVPRGLSWVRGRSACPSCGHVLGVQDLVPVLSWASTHGRCRYCRVRIPWRYPLTELACGAWALLLWQVTGPHLSYPFLALWGFLLIALFWIDLDYQLLPDVLTLPGTLLGVAAALTLPAGGWHAILGMALGSGLLALLAWGYERIRHVEGMGGGDIKLAAMFGAVLGWQLTLVTLALAAFAGTVWGAMLIARKRGTGMTALPFGTLLAPAAMVAFLWGAGWLNAYMRMIRSL